MAQVIWTQNFLEAQGYTVEDNVALQDNQSAMLLEKNGKRSSSKRTHHINIRYFFVTDRIASKEMTVEYCPTGEMNGDFFTKPLQGALFRKFRDRVLNVTKGDLSECRMKITEGDHSDESSKDHRSMLRANDKKGSGHAGTMRDGQPSYVVEINKSQVASEAGEAQKKKKPLTTRGKVNDADRS